MNVHGTCVCNEFRRRADPGPALTVRQGEVPIPHARLTVGRVAGWPSSGFHCVQNLRTIDTIHFHVVVVWGTISCDLNAFVSPMLAW